MNMMLWGILSLLAGVVLMIMGHMWALLLFLAGFALIVAHWAQLFKGAGYRAEGGFYNGLNGQGRQQSEVSKDPNAPRHYEDQPKNI